MAIAQRARRTSQFGQERKLANDRSVELAQVRRVDRDSTLRSALPDRCQRLAHVPRGGLRPPGPVDKALLAPQPRRERRDHHPRTQRCRAPQRDFFGRLSNSRMRRRTNSAGLSPLGGGADTGAPPVSPPMRLRRASARALLLGHR
jgi:hypothetical protein